MSAALAARIGETAAAAVVGRQSSLRPATTYPRRRDGVALLAVDPRAATLFATKIDALPQLLSPGDLLVMNDAATLPASLRGRDERGRAVEARLAGYGAEPGATFQAVLFGAGDWRMRTEDRPAPPLLAAGARLHFGALAASVVAVSPLSPRLVELRFDRRGDALWAALYAQGRLVQYAHLEHELPLWALQNVYAGRPFAFEMPSAGRPLSWRILLAARARGVALATISHAAGLSATGDPALDAALPLPERFAIPAATVAAVAASRRRGARVIAVGTTVVRALEGAFRLWGQLRAGSGVTDLKLDGQHHLQVTDGLLSGLHEPVDSHFALLGAFADQGLLRAAHAFAASRGFRSHELGDSQLILPGVAGPRRVQRGG